MSPILVQAMPTLAVAIIYCIWRWAHEQEMSRHRRLRERVAYMLWSAAHEVD